MPTETGGLLRSKFTLAALAAELPALSYPPYCDSFGYLEEKDSAAVELARLVRRRSRRPGLAGIG